MSSSAQPPDLVAGLSFAKDAWLTDIMSRKVYRINGTIKEGDDSDSERNLRNVTERSDFCYARVPTHDVRTGQLLERCGFRIVDTGVALEMRGLSDRRRNDGCVRFAHAEDQAAVEEIARHSFMYSRFHLDPNIPRSLADEIKAQWARNYFQGKRGDFMVVAERGGEVVGFLQLLKAPGEVLVIDLIAVAEGHRGLGLAGEMIHFTSSACGRPRVIRVGTQITNTASLGLYQKIGFRIVSSSYVFHYHDISR